MRIILYFHPGNCYSKGNGLISVTEKEGWSAMTQKKYELGAMIDCSRGAVVSASSLRRFIRVCAGMGYDFVGLYLEDTIEVEGEPYFGYQRGRLTRKEIREADQYAHSLGMELRPYIQTLAHLNQITDYAVYRDIIDTNDILLAGDERTYRLLDHLLAAVSAAFETRRINIGMDEAHMVGLGKYLDQHGYQDRVSILTAHLGRVMELCRKYEFQPQMWSDMFFRLLCGGEYYDIDRMEQSTRERSGGIEIPDGLELTYWDYYSLDRERYVKLLKLHRQMTPNITFAGGAWRWMGFAPYNRYSIYATEAALSACREQNVNSLVMTMWGDDGEECSPFAVLPALFFAAKKAEKLWSDDGEAVDGEEETAGPGETISCTHAADVTRRFFTQEDQAQFRDLTGFGLEEFLLLDETNPLCQEADGKNNLSKILLFNDPLLGTFDKIVEENPQVVTCFSGAAEEMEKIAGKASAGQLSDDRKDYIDLFRTQAALCRLLARKADYGVKLRKAYKEGDAGTLAYIAGPLTDNILTDIDIFYEAFRTQWYEDWKPFGFEIHTIRIGGLSRRFQDVKRILKEYLEGKRTIIEELEDDILPPGYELESMTAGRMEYNRYGTIASTSKLTW